ncbi:acyl-CoA dehydrogenase family protein [Sphingomonas tabacisoli]|uniref:Acyl-CoA dehydrogenase family protein n=1 Tax=Sphingomonas tabacisoli TaxID=2249466 RepID=A0ABW4I2W1_9SPHN
MNFDYTESQRYWIDRIQTFTNNEIIPALTRYHEEDRAGERFKALPVVDELKAKARAQGLWNLFMPPQSGHEPVDDTFVWEGQTLTNLDYAPLAEIMGKLPYAGEVFNCSAPDTGNMEVLMRYGTREQKDAWLRPLMEGTMRSAFLMTEPGVASSDARNIQTSIRREGDEYVITGRKWWSSGAAHPRCKIFILMGKSSPDEAPYRQQSMILVPSDTQGVTIKRMLPVFGYDHGPHGGHAEIILDNVRVPATNMLLGEGRGFEIAQGRLGPGRIHHAMRSIGVAEAALEAMARRLPTRSTFGEVLSRQSLWENRIAEARIDIEMARLLCLKAAYMMDTVGNKIAKAEIAMIKVAAPRVALKVLDDAIQAHGGAGVSEDFGLAEMWATSRMLRIADGPDEVHMRQIARMEFGKYAEAAE